MIDLEQYQFEQVLDRCLARLPETYNKRANSMIYNALAPVALELSKIAKEIAAAEINTFAGTATGDYLSRCTADRHINRKTATKAVRKGIFADSKGQPYKMTNGYRFKTIDGDKSVIFVVTGEIGAGSYELQCEQVGDIGNQYFGDLLPVTNITGLGKATLSDILIAARDDETDDELRNRYFATINNMAQDGNVAQYYKWVSEYSDIGRAKVYPLWNGPNTVKVSILDVRYNAASDTLIKRFQDFLDPGSTGLGNGAAPIGAIVTVTTAHSVVLNIEGQVTLVAGYTDTASARDAIQDWLQQIAYLKYTVNYLELGAILFQCPCIDNLTGLTINGGTVDIALGQEQIATLGRLDLQVINHG